MAGDFSHRTGRIPGVGIRAIGRYLPQRAVPNSELAARLPTSDAWIRERIGIESRRFAAGQEWSSDLGRNALLDACLQANVEPHELSMVVCGTYTPDHLLPHTAAAITNKAGIPHTPAFDVNSGGCPGSVFALDVGRRYVQSGEYPLVAVVLTDVSSRLFDPEDRTVGVIFGDAAACYLLEPARPDAGIGPVRLGNDSSRYWSVYAARESRRDRYDRPKVSGFGDNFTTMVGSEIREFVLGTVPDFVREFTAKAEVDFADIDLFAVHQANLNLVHGIMDALDQPREKAPTNVERLGNTSGASVPLVLREAVDSGRLRPGKQALLLAFGGGLTFGAALVRWCGPDDFLAPRQLFETKDGQT
ncbi:3-oxoacyl-ACP synthase III family protein [Sciscionella sediminilitoris]|uniref:3-oxoacyl-ACP synthase III family protein n=1 Tax=Sciscionella sediminilitoris TaxID=1445613 RepID=UPI0006904379|nr:ketoacyl-ACP synthase III [Sciscionella sp. SE31]